MSDEIAYQNKDIMSKTFSEQMSNKSLEVYGIKVPRIIGVLKTNLPQVEANELRIDDLFLLEDESIAIIDYESDYKVRDKIKYLNYITRVLAKLEKENKLPVYYFTAYPKRKRGQDCLHHIYDRSFGSYEG